jgi:hypothetical protein
MKKAPVLFAGGSGVVGRNAVKWFRKRYPDHAVLIGTRDTRAAADFVQALEAAQAVTIDLDKPRMGLGADTAVGAVVMMAPDDGLHGLRYAQDLGIPYLNIGNGLVEIGPEVAHVAHRATAAPVVLSSHWAAGAASLLALHTVQGFDAVQSIRLGVLLDSEDPAGPLAYEDMERTTAPATLVFKDGRRTWITGDEIKGEMKAIDGRILATQAYSPLDIISLHAATRAGNVRFDLVTDESSSRRQGGPAAAEIVVEVDGSSDGEAVRMRSTLEFSQGQASLTALSAVLSLGTALGLDAGEPARPGLYLPELLWEPERFLDELRREGATVVTGNRQTDSCPTDVA